MPYIRLFLRAHILNIIKVSGCFVQTRINNFNINFCIVLLCSLDLDLALYCVYMTRERHVILKAALDSRLAAASYIHNYAVLPSYIIIVKQIFFKLVWGTYTYSYSYLASFPSSCIVHNNDTMIIQV